MNAGTERKRIFAGAVSTYYLSAGTGAPVILLHGMAANAGFWQPVIEPLSAHFHVIAPDMVGFGATEPKSLRDDGLSFPAWLGSFMDALEIEKASLVGHSLGGAVALSFALERPERVEKLALVDPIGLGSGASALFTAALFLLPSNPISRRLLRRILAINPERLAAPLVAPKNRGPSTDKGLVRRVLRASGWRALPSFRPEQLGKVSQPTLLLWGERDNVIPVSVGRRALALMPNARLETIAESGHAPFLERPDAFNEIVIRFLGE